MIKYIEFGNIFAIDGIHNYAHGCNCAGAMGKGIALQFKKKYPEMYVCYKRMCDEGKFNPGEVFEYTSEKGEHIYNLGTQKSWKTKAELSFVRISVRKMLALATQNEVTSIALPKIGAGLGGLDWVDVRAILEELSLEFNKVDLFVVENFR